MSNDTYLVAKFGTFEIYLLNPGNCFAGFGGSSAGLLVRKTASLIVRNTAGGMCNDTEYSVNDKRIWNAIFRAAHKEDYDPEPGKSASGKSF